MVRTNLTMSEEIHEWYGSQAAKNGISKNAMMNMALRSYMDGQRAMDAQKDVRAVISQFQTVMEMAKSLGMPMDGGPMAMLEATKAAGNEAMKEVIEAEKRKKAKPSSST